jgi:hypothetical protein
LLLLAGQKSWHVSLGYIEQSANRYVATSPHIHLHGLSPFEFEDDIYQIMDAFLAHESQSEKKKKTGPTCMKHFPIIVYIKAKAQVNECNVTIINGSRFGLRVVV